MALGGSVMPKVLAVAPLDELFEVTAVAAKGIGAWEAFRCKACGWLVTVSDSKNIPPHECPGLYESESLYDESERAEPMGQSASGSSAAGRARSPI
jgi:hypothetical protein